MTRELESEVSLMCNLSKDIEERGMKEGIITAIKNLMESMGWTKEQAMEALKIPEAEQALYSGILKE